MPICEDVCKLSAVCMVCRQDAAFTKRLGKETQVELIGGSDLYVSVCRKCFESDSDPRKIQQTPPKKQKMSLEIDRDTADFNF